MDITKGAYIIFGDINAIRWEFERSGTVFSKTIGDNFNNFIMENDLVEVAMGGYYFTRVGGNVSKLRKLYRFFVS